MSGNNLSPGSHIASWWHQYGIGPGMAQRISPQELLTPAGAWHYLLTFWTEQLTRAACGNFCLQFNVVQVKGKKKLTPCELCWVAECTPMHHFRHLWQQKDRISLQNTSLFTLNSSQLFSVPQHTETRFTEPGSGYAGHHALCGACSGEDRSSHVTQTHLCHRQEL